MNFKIKFSPKATESFEDIIAQLEQRWGEKFVNKFKDKVYEALDVIANTPFMYPPSKENINLRKCVLHKNCSMFYSINDTIIEIHYFWDNRQDPLIAF